MTKPILYSAWFCPFAQRAWIALVHKGVQFDYVEQDPYDKNAHWLAINPRGLVPTIKHEEEVVYESSICIEYVDEAWPQAPSLLPQEPVKRAHVRMWGGFVSKKIVPHYYALLMKETKEERQEAKSALLKGLKTLTEGKSKDGPFFTGKDFGYVDIMVVPYLIRFPVLQEYRGFEVPQEQTFIELQKWKDAMIELDSVKQTMPDMQDLIDKYRRYTDGTAQTEVADAIRRGTGLP